VNNVRVCTVIISEQNISDTDVRLDLNQVRVACQSSRSREMSFFGLDKCEIGKTVLLRRRKADRNWKLFVSNLVVGEACDQ